MTGQGPATQPHSPEPSLERSGPATVIRTVGHGTLEASAFADLVAGAAVELVADVRRYPGSRRYPHFASAEMALWLDSSGLVYRWLPALGGRRRPSADSANVALRNPQFRAYADHMATGEFTAGVHELLEIAAERAVAVMYAETVWWRCHRRLLADHLVLVEGRTVEHLFPGGRLAPHPITPGARLAGDHVAYDTAP
jgi:uncharacterized protein (DUF488 family)